MNLRCLQCRNTAQTLVTMIPQLTNLQNCCSYHSSLLFCFHCFQNISIFQQTMRLLNKSWIGHGILTNESALSAVSQYGTNISNHDSSAYQSSKLLQLSFISFVLLSPFSEYFNISANNAFVKQKLNWAWDFNKWICAVCSVTINHQLACLENCCNYHWALFVLI